MAEENTPKTELVSTEQLPDRVNIAFIKSPFFRTLAADGIFGGLTPRGKIAMSIYSERFPVPEQISLSVLPDGSIGEELVDARINRDAIIRELEVNVLLDLDVAATLHDWLDRQLRRAYEILKEERPGESTSSGES